MELNKTPWLFIGVPLTSEESEQSYIFVLRIECASISTIFRFDCRIVQTVSYFCFYYYSIYRIWNIAHIHAKFLFYWIRMKWYLPFYVKHLYSKPNFFKINCSSDLFSPNKQVLYLVPIVVVYNIYMYIMLLLNV